MSKVELFTEEYPSIPSYMRAIILFGRNVATYKFALGKSLFEIVPNSNGTVTLEELADPYSKYLCEHIRNSPKQATSSSSEFLQACSDYNIGKITHEKLIDITVRKGFNNVIDAFHVVNSKPIPIEFFQKDYQKGSKKIILSDELYQLAEMKYSNNFTHEIESRWNLVETAWGLGVSTNLLNVKYDEGSKDLYVDKSLRRKSVTSARDALNGYQKGKCFYCFNDISISEDDHMNCDVDHFYPHTLQAKHMDINFNGIWNLVLACPKCNRGQDGKFALVPEVVYLKRLHKRNEFLISSHHPLRETLMSQTGVNEQARIDFMKNVDRLAINDLIHRWRTDEIGEKVF